MLTWEQVKWAKAEDSSHKPETARYHCLECNAAWKDEARWTAIAKGRWIADAPFNGTAGFHLNEIRAGEKAVTSAMQGAGADLKSAWRNQITGAGLGTRLSNSIRHATYPKSGENLNAAALVWSKAPVIIGAHDAGPLIRSKDGFWLAIPTAVAGRSSRGGRVTPAEWERRTGLRLRFVYRLRGPSLLVAEGRLNSKGRVVASRSKTGRGVATMPIFLLVPQVKLPKPLDLARDAERAVDSVPVRIVKNWGEGPS